MGRLPPEGVPGEAVRPGGHRRGVLAVIPAYEAAELVGDVVAGALRHLPVLVVDDGSADDTSGAARAAGAEVARQEPNQGKGAALKRGFRLALERGCEAVVTLDADGQHDPAEIPAFLGAWQTERSDLVIGVRDFTRMPPARRVANTFARWTLSRVVGREIPDNQSGYRLLSRRLARHTLEIGESGYEFEVEMLLRCLRRGWPISWIPIRTIYEGAGSHISPLEHAVRFGRMLIRAARAGRAGERPPASRRPGPS
ncbi:MAG: glycosyltransferase family 2 protein [Gemmatimonadota bacterium]